MEPIPVKTSSRLRVTYSLHLAANPVSPHVVALQHGILHSRATFLDLIAALNELGLHAVMIEQQSQDAGFWRNCIGLGAYAEGMKDALLAIRAALAERTEPLQIGIVAVHSMGGEIWEETREKYPELRRPTVMMAPIPQNGAFGTSLRLLRDHPFAFLKAGLTFNVLSLAKTPLQVRQLFFDETAADEVVRRTTEQLTHSPFWSYLQLTFRWLLRPKISRQDMPLRLLWSPSDYLFHPQEFAKTRQLYGELLDEREMRGGHDFFIGDARPAALAIQEFFEKHKKTPPPGGGEV